MAGSRLANALCAGVIGFAFNRYGLTLAICKVDGFDIGAEMVRGGMACAFTRYSVDYVGQQAEAKSANRGVHQYYCEAAWDYRARVKTENRPN